VPVVGIKQCGKVEDIFKNYLIALISTSHIIDLKNMEKGRRAPGCRLNKSHLHVIDIDTSGGSSRFKIFTSRFALLINKFTRSILVNADLKFRLEIIRIALNVKAS
jgi:hypothetical protein